MVFCRLDGSIMTGKETSLWHFTTGKETSLFAWQFSNFFKGLSLSYFVDVYIIVCCLLTCK